MRTAVEQLQVHAGGMPRDHRLDQRAQARHHRQHEAQMRTQPLHLGGRAEQARRDVLDLGAPAARQQRDDGVVFAQRERDPARGSRHFERNCIGQRMADIRRRDTVARVDRRLEWKHAQHMVDRAAHLLDALAAPGPDRRADEMDRLDAGLLEPAFELEIEVGRIDADEGVGALVQQPLGEPPADARDLAVVPQHQDVAAHREAIMRPPGVETVSRHSRSADAERAQCRPACLQSAEQQSGEQIARGLAGHHREPRCAVVHPGAINGRCRASIRRGRSTSSRRRQRPRVWRP